MSAYQRVSYCIFGALTSLILNLASIDVGATFSNFSLVVGIGFFSKIFVMLFCGGVVAFLYVEENSPRKLFHLGIAAPALIASLIHPAGNSNQLTYLSIVPPALAQTSDTQIQSLPAPPSTVDQFIQGFIGSKRPVGGYYVILGSSATPGGAVIMADKLNKTWNNAINNDAHWVKYKAATFQKYDNSKYYAVVLGENLSLEEATELKSKALQVGLPSDTYVWTNTARLK